MDTWYFLFISEQCYYTNELKTQELVAAYLRGASLQQEDHCKTPTAVGECVAVPTVPKKEEEMGGTKSIAKVISAVVNPKKTKSRYEKNKSSGENSDEFMSV